MLTNISKKYTKKTYNKTITLTHFCILTLNERNLIKLQLFLSYTYLSIQMKKTKNERTCLFTYLMQRFFQQNNLKNTSLALNLTQLVFSASNLTYFYVQLNLLLTHFALLCLHIQKKILILVNNYLIFQAIQKCFAKTSKYLLSQDTYFSTNKLIRFFLESKNRKKIQDSQSYK
ncbi:hypothetical protein ABPG74_016609 [Tetrahymena malaccensis]